VLHNLGFSHFAQIAQCTPAEIVGVDDHLKSHGRIKREEWTKQCKLLAAGKEEEFNKLFGTGGMKNKAGQTQSGTRTKK
jgi:NADH-quinone oxidoreductase subunit E